MKKVLGVRHVAAETMGRIGDALAARRLEIDEVAVDRGDEVPLALGDAEALVVMGGPMGVYDADRHPHLRRELRLIEDALARGAPVLGVCLGSQLLATALGARVRKGVAKEIGWYPVHLSADGALDGVLGRAPRSFTALHWHGDVFDLPKGAAHLASSDRTENQAFRWGVASYGVLFHLEVDEQILRGMCAGFGDELAEVGLDEPTMTTRGERHLNELSSVSAQVFGAWADAIVARRAL